MSSVARASKRKRSDDRNPSVTNACSLDDSAAIGQGSSITVLQLVEHLAIAPDSTERVDILEKIRTHQHFPSMETDQVQQSMIYRYDQQRWIRKLHGCLVIFLGSVSGSLAETPLMFLNALIFCFRDLYSSDRVSMTDYIAVEEFEELFSLLPLLVLRMMSSESGPFGTSHSIHRVVGACNHIMISWSRLPSLLDTVLSKSPTTALENFLLAVLASTNHKKSIHKNGAKTYELLDSLQWINNCKQYEIHPLWNVWRLAVRGVSPIDCGDLLPRFHIFYWRCISKLSVPRRVNDGKQYDPDVAVESLLPLCTTNDNAQFVQAMTCIADFIEEASDATHVRLMEFLVKSIPKGYGPTDCNCEKRLVPMLHLFAVCTKRINTMEAFLQRKESEDILDGMVSIAFDPESTKRTAETAASTILPIVNFVIVSSEDDSQGFFRKSIEILSALLSLRNTTILLQTLDTLWILLHDRTSMRRMLTSNSLALDLIEELSLLAPETSLAKKPIARLKLAQSFTLLVASNLTHLARQPSTLSFLVLLASGSYLLDRYNDGVREKAIAALLTLAQNPCNRRILSKVPGLLSSLIQYTRSIPEGANLDENEIFLKLSRDEINDRIVRLAGAL